MNTVKRNRQSKHFSYHLHSNDLNNIFFRFLFLACVNKEGIFPEVLECLSIIHFLGGKAILKIATSIKYGQVFINHILFLLTINVDTSGSSVFSRFYIKQAF